MTTIIHHRSFLPSILPFFVSYMWYDEIFLDIEEVFRADHLHVVELGADLLFHHFQEPTDRRALAYLHHLHDDDEDDDDDDDTS